MWSSTYWDNTCESLKPPATQTYSFFLLGIHFSTILFSLYKFKFHQSSIYLYKTVHQMSATMKPIKYLVANVTLVVSTIMNWSRSVYIRL